jgi:hypothetical protein
LLVVAAIVDSFEYAFQDGEECVSDQLLKLKIAVLNPLHVVILGDIRIPFETIFEGCSYIDQVLDVPLIKVFLLVSLVDVVDNELQNSQSFQSVARVKEVALNH